MKGQWSNLSVDSEILKRHGHRSAIVRMPKFSLSHAKQWRIRMTSFWGGSPTGILSDIVCYDLRTFHIKINV